MPPETITVKEVRFAIKSCATAAERAKASDAADEVKKAAMMGVFERLLGIKSEKELAVLSREDIERIAKRRVKRGDVELEGFNVDELMKVIQQSACRRNVSWKDAFIAEVGESKAKDLQASAAETHSYKFVDSGELGMTNGTSEAGEAVGQAGALRR